MKYLVLNEHGTDKKPKGYITLTNEIIKKYEKENF